MMFAARYFKTWVLFAGLSSSNGLAQNASLSQQVEKAMYGATMYMSDSVSTNGGYVWYYLPDLSRRWGEMEAYKTMVWVQDGGTVSVGHTLLDAYKVTGNEYYYTLAEKAAAAMIWGQSNEGGWNYMIDFAGDHSLKAWYNTIGKNGWRLEEFQHFYGNDTYDDDVTSDAARFLLRIYLEKLDAKYKPALDKAIHFMLKSQYPNGGWPQRYPLKHDFKKAGHEDYSSYYTYNDDVIWENLNFLMQCYVTLGEERFLEPIKKAMRFYMLSQTSSGGWGQQYDMHMNPAGARTYEPAALLPRTTFSNAMLLIKFYQYTGDKKYLARVPDAIKWLEKNRLPQSMADGRFTHPTFIHPTSGRPLYVHRKGSNVTHGYYYVDNDDKNLLKHYGGKTFIDVERLKQEYKRVSALSREEAIKESPLFPQKYGEQGTPQSTYQLTRYDEYGFEMNVSETRVLSIVNALDSKNRWLVKHAMISNPYIGDGQNKELTNAYASTHVGDNTDTSPYMDNSDQLYISTPAYIRNMQVLIKYLQSVKKTDRK